ncbi:MAG: aminotransferase class I/II-fold pyridoxal phosphate-dependent enzyme [bacterium]|nr:aminotransferase class I/II-fold pyridoxal phosphate-dependent enzyme [bacterium]
MRNPIDLRSDTVTQPTPAMRKAMAEAIVGDDVYGEDPTINLLEKRAATLLNREAGLLVPTGTMGNQIAIHVHTRPGTEVIGEAQSHIFHFEMGAMAALSGTFGRPVASEKGILSPSDVESAIQPYGGHRTPTSLLSLENSHNLASGRITPPSRMRELVDVAKRYDLPVHLDGARVHNAAAALGISAAELTNGCDTVMFCLSKGLGAPVGSMLVGDAETIDEARRIRKMFGGGMRQAGVLAAAGLVAFDEVLPTLQNDNNNAKRLAEHLSQLPTIVLDPEEVDTNIVFFSLSTEAPMDARSLATKLNDAGVLVHALDAESIRMVTHYHISQSDIDRAAKMVSEILTTS